MNEPIYDWSLAKRIFNVKQYFNLIEYFLGNYRDEDGEGEKTGISWCLKAFL
jgi:hypothetical protein